MMQMRVRNAELKNAKLEAAGLLAPGETARSIVRLTWQQLRERGIIEPQPEVEDGQSVLGIEQRRLAHMAENDRMLVALGVLEGRLSWQVRCALAEISRAQ